MPLTCPSGSSSPASARLARSSTSSSSSSSLSSRSKKLNLHRNVSVSGRPPFCNVQHARPS